MRDLTTPEIGNHRELVLPSSHVFKQRENASCTSWGLMWSSQSDHDAHCQYKSELALLIIAKASGPFPPLPVVTNTESLLGESGGTDKWAMPSGFWLPNPGLRIMLFLLWGHFKDRHCRERVQESHLPHVSASLCLYIAGKAPIACWPRTKFRCHK